MNRTWIIRILLGTLRVVAPIALVGAGVGASVALVKMRKPPQKIEAPVIDPLVKVVHIDAADIPMIVHGYGEVRPKVQVDIVPEVSGKVVAVHPQLKVGGYADANEPLIQIDRRDYELALQQANAAVADAQVRVDTEIAEANVARREWDQLNPGVEPTSPLVIREPQIAQARAMLDSANAQLAIAQLRLERTTVSMPFNVRIVSEKVDAGQYVVAGQSVASAYGVETVEIEVPLEDSDLAWFDVFAGDRATGTDRPGTRAEVIARIAGVEHLWDGHVTRTVGQVDRMSRLVSVVVEVANPFDSGDAKPPLLPGTFVRVRIKGRVLPDAFAVPRNAVRAGNELWVIRDDRLHVETPEIIRADRDFAYIASTDRQRLTVAVSALDTPINGMKVRVSGDGEPTAKTESTPNEPQNTN